MLIIIPMAGASSRFITAGYGPKYRLVAHSRSLFAWSLLSFQRYFSCAQFLFITGCSDDEAAGFIRSECKNLGVAKFAIQRCEKVTTGQAETVLLGSRPFADDCGPVVVFNIDTIRPAFELPSESSQWDGYLEVFRGSGSNWSYARPQSERSTRVVETAEKTPISALCSTGLYHFRSLAIFRRAWQLSYEDKAIDELPRGETYIAPLYNALIEQNYQIHYAEIKPSEVVFAGVPAEYEALKSSTLAPINVPSPHFGDLL